MALIGDIVVNILMDAAPYVASTGIVVAAIVATKTALTDMGVTANTAAEAMRNLGEKASAMASAMASRVRSAAGSVAASVSDGVQRITGVLSAMFQEVRRVAISAMSATGGVISECLDAIASIHPLAAGLVNVVRIAATAIGDMLRTIGGAVWDAVSAMASAIGDMVASAGRYVLNIIKIVAAATIAEWLSMGLATGVIVMAILKGMASMIGSMLAAVGRAAWSVATTIVSAIGSILSSIGSVLYSLVGAVWDVTKALVSAIGGVFSSLWGMVSATMGVFTSFFTQSTSSVGGLISALLGLNVILAATKALWAAVKGAAADVATMESTQSALRVLAGPSQGVELYKQMQEYALTTSFSIDGVTVSTQKLLAAGIAAGDILPIMDMLGNLAMGNTFKLAKLTKALSDVKQKGSLTGQDTTQFTENGVGLVPALAMYKFGDATAASTAKILEMRAAHLITYRDVTEALRTLTGVGGRFHGMLGEEAKTVGGLWQMVTENMSVNIRDFTALLSEAFAVKEILAVAVEWFGRVGQVIASLKPIATAMHDAIIRNWDSIEEKLNTFGNWLAGWARTGWLGPLAWAIVWIKDNFDWLVEALIFGFDHIGEVAAYAAAYLTHQFNAAYADVGFFFSDKLPAALENLKIVWHSVFSDLSGYMTQFGENMSHNMTVAFAKMGLEAKKGMLIAKDAAKGAVDFLPGAEGRAQRQAWTQPARLMALGMANPTGEFKLLDGMKAPTTPRLNALPQREKTSEELMDGLRLALRLALSGQVLKDKFSKFRGRDKKPAPEAVKLDKGGEDNSSEDNAKGDPKRFGGALERGSQDAYSAILAAMGGGDSLRTAREQLVTERAMLAELKRGNATDQRIPNVESFA